MKSMHITATQAIELLNPGSLSNRLIKNGFEILGTMMSEADQHGSCEHLVEPEGCKILVSHTSPRMWPGEYSIQLSGHAQDGRDVDQALARIQ
jgi:hypothetical protein